MSPRVVFPLVFALASAFAGCSSCKKTEEPAHETRFDPAPGGSARASAAATPSASGPRLTRMEERERHVRLASDLCENAAKQYNKVKGRAETDPAGIDVLSSCLKRGNNAWYMCVLQASTPDAFEECGRRLLFVPDTP